MKTLGSLAAPSRRRRVRPWPPELHARLGLPHLVHLRLEYCSLCALLACVNARAARVHARMRACVRVCVCA